MLQRKTRPAGAHLIPTMLLRMTRITSGQAGKGERRFTHMPDCRAFQARGIFLRNVFLAAGFSFLAAIAGCKSSSPPEQPAAPTQRYHLTGRVVSVEPSKQQVTVDAGDIPGFMSAMTMGYPV